MVRARLKSAVERLTTKPVESKVTRRLIIVMRLADGDWVLQKEDNSHQSHHRYSGEAKSTFRDLFLGKKEPSFSPESDADKVLAEVLGFRRTSDIELCKNHFERAGVEWHPVMIHLHYYGMDSAFIKKRANLEGRIFKPISEHEFASKLAKIFPPEH